MKKQEADAKEIVEKYFYPEASVYSELISDISAALLKASEDAKREVLSRMPSLEQFLIWAPKLGNERMNEVYAQLRDRLTNGETK